MLSVVLIRSMGKGGRRHWLCDCPRDEAKDWQRFFLQLELLLLQPKASAAPGTSRPYDATEECKMFKARGSCPFGQRCKYRHGRRADDKPEAAAGPKNG